MTLISLLIALILIGVIFWAVRAICAAFGVPNQIAVVIQVLLVLFVVIWLLQSFGGVGPVINVR